jgi:putative SOS response-associated peptidase YedK
LPVPRSAVWCIPMCGRYSANFTFREIRLRWKINSADDAPLFVPRFNIAPSQQVPAIISCNGTREVRHMQWGLVPEWTKDPDIGSLMINARAETLTGKASFKELVVLVRVLRHVQAEK